MTFRFPGRAPPPPPENASLLGRATQQLHAYTGQLPFEGMRSVLGDFQDFIQQGNMLNMAVGLILGASFTAILNSFVVDILSPILSLFSSELPRRRRRTAGLKP